MRLVWFKLFLIPQPILVWITKIHKILDRVYSQKYQNLIGNCMENLLNFDYNNFEVVFNTKPGWSLINDSFKFSPSKSTKSGLTSVGHLKLLEQRVNICGPKNG